MAQSDTSILEDFIRSSGRLLRTAAFISGLYFCRHPGPYPNCCSRCALKIQHFPGAVSLPEHHR